MLNNYVKTFINQMARRTGTYLTERHKRILEFAYTYYEKNQVGPLYKNIERYTGASRQDIEELFPNGLNSVYSWIGIPIQTANDICKPVANVKVDNRREVYFDYNATTPIRKEVRKVLSDYYNDPYNFGNPSSSTYMGKAAFDATLKSRRQIADCLGASPNEIIFTSCGTESNNMAVKGVALRYMQTRSKGHIITTCIEHSSVMEAIQFMGMFDFEVTFLDPGPDGLIKPEAVKNALRSNTILVSVMAVNNEIGTIYPIAEIAEICRLAEVPFMVDAIQAFGKIDIRPKDLGVTLMSLSGHKIYGPKGVGALFVDNDFDIDPILHGGGQEFYRRSGTENVGHIIGFGKAAECICKDRESEYHRITEIRDYFLENLDRAVPGYIVNGSLEKRSPYNLNIGFPDVDSGALLISLNQIGIYVSAGAACSAGSKEVSPVISALGVDTDKYGAIRFSFGLHTTKEDVDYLFQYLPEIIDQIRSG